MWKLYTNNTELWTDMLEACRHATKSIDLEQFIFVNDEIGKQFIDICSEKAKQGVRVRFLFDDAGVRGRLLWDDVKSTSIFSSLIFSDLSKRGIQVGFFNTIIPRSIDNHRWWFFRNHRRSLIVDSEVAFTGSMMLSKNTEKWYDANLRMTGGVVSSIENAFDILWDRAHNIRTDWGDDASPTGDSGGFSYVTNSPIPNKQFLYYRLIEAIRSARKSVLIVNPYFVPDRRLLRVLRLATRRGVDVRLLLPRTSNHPVVDLAGRSYYSSLFRSNVSIYQNPKKGLHAKIAIIDDDWATLGTLNLDRVSLHYNFEANIIGTDRAFVAELREYCMRQMRTSERIDPSAWEHRGTAHKWLEFVVRFIRTFL